MSRSRAELTDRRATADVADQLLTPPWGQEARIQWARDRETYQPSDADRARAQSILAWARGLSGASDYEQNLRLVANQPAIGRGHAGILASAISAYDRQASDRADRQAETSPPSRHLGQVGEKRDFGRVTCERIASFDSEYGVVHVHTFRDAAGNAIVWKTGARKAEPAGVVEMLTGTIKRHSEFRGEAQTELTRCALLGADDLARRSAPKAPRARKPRAPRYDFAAGGTLTDWNQAKDI